MSGSAVSWNMLMSNKALKLHMAISEIQNTADNSIILSLLSELEYTQNWLYANYIPIMSITGETGGRPEIFFLGDITGITIRSCPYLEVAPLHILKKSREETVSQIIGVLDKRKYILFTNEQNSPIQYQPYNKKDLCSAVMLYGFNNDEKVIYASVFSPYKQQFTAIPYTHFQKIIENADSFTVNIKGNSREENPSPYAVLRHLKHFYSGKAYDGLMESTRGGIRYYGLSVLEELIGYYSTSYKCGLTVEVDTASLIDIYSHQQLLAGAVEYLEICGIIDWRHGLYFKAADMEADMVKAIGLSIKYNNCPSEKIMNRLLEFLSTVRLNEKNILSAVFKGIQPIPQVNFLQENESCQEKISIARRQIPFFGSSISFQLCINEDYGYKIFIDAAEYNARQHDGRIEIGPLINGYHNMYIDSGDKRAYIDSVKIKS